MKKYGKVKNDKGQCKADFRCTDCMGIWEEWIPDPCPESTAIPQKRRRCDSCIRRLAAPTLLKAFLEAEGRKS